MTNGVRYSPLARVLGSRPVRLAGLVLLVLALAACSRSMGDLEQRMAQERQRVSPEIEPLPEMRPYETFEYVAGGRRDPFRLPRVETPEGAALAGPRPDPDRRREPLESYTLDSLTMVGTFERGSDYFALVMDPEGIVHRVREGNYMGQNDGRVVSISEVEVRLVELIPDVGEGWRERTAAVALTD